MFFPIWWRGRGRLIPLIAVVGVMGTLLLSNAIFGPRADHLGLAGGLVAAAILNALAARGQPGSSLYSIPMFAWSIAMVAAAIWRIVY